MSALGMACMNSCLGGSKEKFGLKYCVTEMCTLVFWTPGSCVFSFYYCHISTFDLQCVSISRN